MARISVGRQLKPPCRRLPGTVVVVIREPGPLSTVTRDPLEPFEDQVVIAVAEEYDVSPERLRELVRRQQELVRRLPGVDDIVYEWRKGFPNDPVVERRPDAYYLSVAETVWPEFVEALSLDDREATLLQAVHRRQLAATVGGYPTGERGAMVLTRE
jgi:hypothetical protein